MRLNIIGIAFSYTNRLRLGQAKGGLVFWRVSKRVRVLRIQGSVATQVRKEFIPCVPVFISPIYDFFAHLFSCLLVYLSTYFRVYVSTCLPAPLRKRPRRRDIHVQSRNMTGRVAVISRGGDHRRVIGA